MSNSNDYDLTIAYRIYPGISKTPFVHADNKLKLIELGIRTLKQSLTGSRAKILFLLDNCPPEYEQMIRSYFDEKDILFYEFDGIGNLATFLKQIELLLAQPYSDIVMFAEDDYVYRRNELSKAIAFIRHNKSADFVTPYDHLDSYVLPIHTRHQYEIIVQEGLHWRTASSTCLTFLTTKKTLRETETTFNSYGRGNWDSSLWFSLTKYNIFDLPAWFFIRDWFFFKIILKSWGHGWQQNLFGKKYTLWQPIPSIATHMEKIALAPSIDWDRVISDSEENTI